MEKSNRLKLGWLFLTSTVLDATRRHEERRAEQRRNEDGAIWVSLNENLPSWKRLKTGFELLSKDYRLYPSGEGSGSASAELKKRWDRELAENERASSMLDWSWLEDNDTPKHIADMSIEDWNDFAEDILLRHAGNSAQGASPALPEAVFDLLARSSPIANGVN